MKKENKIQTKFLKFKLQTRKRSVDRSVQTLPEQVRIGHMEIQCELIGGPSESASTQTNSLSQEAEEGNSSEIWSQDGVVQRAMEKIIEKKA